MRPRFLDQLRAAVPDAWIEARGDHFEIAVDGGVADLAVPEMVGDAPVELVFATIPLHGFELALDAPPQRFTLASKHIAFEIYKTRSNDQPMAELWLDVAARSALVRAVRSSEQGLRLAGIRAELELDRIVATPFSMAAADLGPCVRAAVSLATRPHRIAEELRLALRGLGMRLDADEWRLDDTCRGVFTRGAATVRLEWRRTRKLQTRLVARGPLAPKTIDAAWLAPRLEAHAALVGAARAASITAARGEVTLVWDGIVRMPQALAPGVELLSRLVAPPIDPPPIRSPG